MMKLREEDSYVHSLVTFVIHGHGKLLSGEREALSTPNENVRRQAQQYDADG